MRLVTLHKNPKALRRCHSGWTLLSFMNKWLALKGWHLDTLPMPLCIGLLCFTIRGLAGEASLLSALGHPGQSFKGEIHPMGGQGSHRSPVPLSWCSCQILELTPPVH